MITIYVDSNIIDRKHEIKRILEEEMSELRCYYKYDIIEDYIICEGKFLVCGCGYFFDGDYLYDKITRILSDYIIRYYKENEHEL